MGPCTTYCARCASPATPLPLTPSPPLKSYHHRALGTLITHGPCTTSCAHCATLPLMPSRGNTNCAHAPPIFYSAPICSHIEPLRQPMCPCTILQHLAQPPFATCLYSPISCVHLASILRPSCVHLASTLRPSCPSCSAVESLRPTCTLLWASTSLPQP